MKKINLLPDILHQDSSDYIYSDELLFFTKYFRIPLKFITLKFRFIFNIPCTKIRLTLLNVFSAVCMASSVFMNNCNKISYTKQQNLLIVCLNELPSIRLYFCVFLFVCFWELMFAEMFSKNCNNRHRSL